MENWLNNYTLLVALRKKWDNIYLSLCVSLLVALVNSEATHTPPYNVSQFWSLYVKSEATYTSPYVFHIWSLFINSEATYTSPYNVSHFWSLYVKNEVTYTHPQNRGLYNLGKTSKKFCQFLPFYLCKEIMSYMDLPNLTLWPNHRLFLVLSIFL